MNELLFFENGQFSEQDIIQLGRQYVTAEQQDVKVIFNSAAILLRQNPNLKNGQIILLTDENLLTTIQVDEEWEKAFFQFKNDQKISVSCVLVHDQEEIFHTPFVDLFILKSRDQLVYKSALAKSNSNNYSQFL